MNNVKKYCIVTFVFVPLVYLKIYSGASEVLILVMAHIHPQRWASNVWNKCSISHMPLFHSPLNRPHPPSRINVPSTACDIIIFWTVKDMWHVLGGRGLSNHSGMRTFQSRRRVKRREKNTCNVDPQNSDENLVWPENSSTGFKRRFSTILQERMGWILIITTSLMKITFN